MRESRRGNGDRRRDEEMTTAHTATTYYAMTADEQLSEAQRVLDTHITSSATGRASAIYNAQRQLGAAFGVAVLSAVLGIVGPTYRSATGVVQPNLTAYHAAFLTAAGFALIAACIALTVHDSDAAVTMQRRGKRSGREGIPEQTQRAEVLS